MVTLVRRAHPYSFLIGLTLICAPRVLRAEMAFPGVRSGVYHTDRWGQHSFSYEFVAPALDEQLAQHAGAPLRLNATKVRQVSNPGASMIESIEGVERLPALLKVEVAWDGEADPAKLLQIRDGGTARLRITITNISPSAVPLADCPLFVTVRIHRPCTAGFNRDPLGYWSQRQSLDLDWSFSERLCFCDASRYLRILDTEIPFIDGGFRIHTVLDRDRAPVIETGKSISWSIPLTRIPANEYEVAVGFDQRRILGDSDRERVVFSNWLRLDALSDKSEAWDGLRLHLEGGGTKNIGSIENIAVVFTNEGNDRIQLAIPKGNDGRPQLVDSLLLYDAHGSLIELPKGKGPFQTLEVLLDARDEYRLNVGMPEGAVIARVAWLNNTFRPKTDGEPRRLRYGYVFSQHLRLRD